MTLLYIGGETKIHLAEMTPAFGNARPSLRFLQSLEVGAMPSFLAFSPDGRFALAVAEGADELVCLRVDEKGLLDELSRAACPGGPAYVSWDPLGCWAYTASYGGGETRVFSVNHEGILSSAVSSFETGRYSHCAVVFRAGNEAELACASKGTDSIAWLRRESDGRLLRLMTSEAPSGSGPRHIVFSPDRSRAYVTGENDCSLMTWDCTFSEPRLLDHTCTLQSHPKQGDSGSDLHLSEDGSFLYVSNRGDDSLAVYRLGEGAPELLEHQSTRGEVPRNFCLLSQDLLVVANQESANLAIFSRDKQRGTLEYRGLVDAPERAFWVGNASSR